MLSGGEQRAREAPANYSTGGASRQMARRTCGL